MKEIVRRYVPLRGRGRGVYRVAYRVDGDRITRYLQPVPPQVVRLPSGKGSGREVEYLDYGHGIRKVKGVNTTLSLLQGAAGRGVPTSWPKGAADLVGKEARI